jgi:radical SAM superfamily enzyme YgiQ (UPF0313 family)
MEKIDFLFIHTPKFNSYYKIIGEYISIMNIPVGLWAIADYLNQNGIKTKILHLGIEKINNKNFSLKEYLSKTKPKIVGIPIHWHHQSYSAIEVAKEIKNFDNDIFIVLGGFTASLFSTEILQNFECINAIIRGEGEIPVLELCRFQDFKNIQNLVYRDSYKIIQNEISYIADDEMLSKLNFTNFELMENYNSYINYVRTLGTWPKNFKKETILKDIFSEPKIFPIVTHRGCPVECSYCGGGRESYEVICNRYKIARRDVNSVIKSIIDIAKYGFEIAYFPHDPHPNSPEYFIEIFKKIKENNINISGHFDSWRLPKEDFLLEFKNTFKGKYNQIHITPETANEELRRKNRGFYFSNEELIETLNILENLQIPVGLHFVIGLPGESIQTIYQTVNFQKQLSKKYKYITLLNTFKIQLDPGSSAFLHPEKYGIEKKWSSFMDFYNEHSKINNFTDLESGYFIPNFSKNYLDFNKKIQKIKCKFFCKNAESPYLAGISFPKFTGKIICKFVGLWWRLRRMMRIVF